MPGRNFTDEEEMMIAAIYRAGNSARAIARAYRLPGKESVIGALRRQNVTQRSPAERNRLYQLDPLVFDNFTPEMAYWWGFLYADGYVDRDKSLIVNLKNSDHSHLQSLLKFLHSQAPIRISTNYIGTTGYKRSTLYVTDRHLASKLQALGIVKGRTKFDRVISQLPNELASHWIRGVFDGDGSIDFRIGNGQPRWRLIGQLEMLEWVRLQLLPVVSTQSPKIHRSGMYYLTISGRRKVSRVGEFIYADALVYLDRKCDLIEKTYIKPSERERDKLGRYC